MLSSRWSWFGGLVSLVILTGCSSGDAERPMRVPVTGKVIYQGKPVEGAHVTFVPQGQGLNSAFGTTDAAGVFKLSTFEVDDGAQPGAYAVTISKMVIEGGQKPGSEPLNTGTPPPPPKTMDLLPAKYKAAATSNLSATVVEGKANEFPFELE